MPLKAVWGCVAIPAESTEHREHWMHTCALHTILAHSKYHGRKREQEPNL